jgi:choline dehydrogenase-like flavoprotein
MTAFDYIVVGGGTAGCVLAALLSEDLGGARRTRAAEREVILPAGTVGSLRLLLLSGSGPRKHLRDLAKVGAG